MADGNQLMIYLGANCFYSDSAMNAESKIKCRRTNGQHFYVPFRCVYINFFSKKTGFEILEKINTVCLLVAYHLPYLLKPFVKATLIRCVFFIFPMCG